MSELTSQLSSFKLKFENFKSGLNASLPDVVKSQVNDQFLSYFHVSNWRRNRGVERVTTHSSS